MENPMNKWMIWGVFPLFLVQHPYRLPVPYQNSLVTSVPRSSYRQWKGAGYVVCWPFFASEHGAWCCFLGKKSLLCLVWVLFQMCGEVLMLHQYQYAIVGMWCVPAWSKWPKLITQMEVTFHAWTGHFKPPKRVTRNNLVYQNMINILYLLWCHVSVKV